MALVADLDEKKRNQSTLLHSPKENISVKIAAKISSVNETLVNNCCMMELSPRLVITYIYISGKPEDGSIL